MSAITQLYFQIVEEINYMFRPFSGCAIIRLRLEYWRKLIYYNVDNKNGGTRCRFTMFGEVRSYIYGVWCYRRCVAIYMGCGITDSTSCRRVSRWLRETNVCNIWQQIKWKAATLNLPHAVVKAITVMCKCCGTVFGCDPNRYSQAFFVKIVLQKL
jgi:hypothetical protein